MRASVLSVVALLTLCLSLATADPRGIETTYRNPAEGFAITIPVGLKGVAGDQAGPERGVKIPLPSSGQIDVWGEPNSLEWGAPADGIRFDLTKESCGSGDQQVSPVRVGHLIGSQATLLCGDRVVRVLLVFRPGGGPIYWLRLVTSRAHLSNDAAILSKAAASFKLIRWR
jgi:hypothetical protein